MFDGCVRATFKESFLCFFWFDYLCLMFEKKFNKKTGSTFCARQWGTEHDTAPLSYLHKKPSYRVVAFSRASIVLTVLFWLAYVVSVIVRQLIDGEQSYHFTIEAFGYLVIVTFLTFSALVYLIARQGAFERFSQHVRTPRALLGKHFSAHQSSITVLIPSYSEETQTIRKTMISAALQEFPAIRVVLLVDDNPFAVRPEDVERLCETRLLGVEIKKLFSRPHARFSRALKTFESVEMKKKSLPENALLTVASEYIWASEWLFALAQKELVEDHVDTFFVEQVLEELAKDFRLVADALIASYKEEAQLSTDRVLELYHRLVWVFGFEIEVFERKRYTSLSHEPNKAMNLNSYIGLMGGAYRKEEAPNGVVLSQVKGRKRADLVVPDSDFLLTLDADSILLKDYCLRLTYFLEQPDNADVAVVQTPYSSFRGASTRLERLSGATTDIQHIIHQGMSHYGATFWVGANAVIRKKALLDIVEKEWVGGFEIKRYIQDRTVIEDTESSIDLAVHGWRLVNYPERLSYSATPPDFGSLIIQRRRWANGGLLILPKLLKLVRNRKNKGMPLSKVEFIIRLNYMASIAWSSFGLVFLLAFPYDGRLLSPLVLLAAVPYFFSMAMDLKYCRYRYSDILRIYGFNLILLPVNIAGTLKSLQQALTGAKTPFARTPKVKNRTASALPYLFSPLFIVGFSLFTLVRNIDGENWGNAVFAGFNTFASLWAIVSYIGIRNMFVDMWLGFKDMLYVDVSRDNNDDSVVTDAGIDWRGVLYHGEESGVVPHDSLVEMVVRKK